jgi:hypothetical protein
MNTKRRMERFIAEGAMAQRQREIPLCTGRPFAGAKGRKSRPAPFGMTRAGWGRGGRETHRAKSARWGGGPHLRRPTFCPSGTGWGKHEQNRRWARGRNTRAGRDALRRPQAKPPLPRKLLPVAGLKPGHYVSECSKTYFLTRFSVGTTLPGVCHEPSCRIPTNERYCGSCDFSC